MIRLGWHDDAVTVVCTDDACLVDGHWWTFDLPYSATPADAQAAADAHRADKHPGE